MHLNSQRRRLARVLRPLAVMPGGMMRAMAGRRLALQALGAAALLLTLSVDLAVAQSGASTGLMGQVTDSSGAAVPGVTVTLTNIDTGSARTVTTGSTGDWQARFL